MSDRPIKSPRKLIEVALPLDAINAACAREKSIRHGHPSTLHLWWARRPLAAARAVKSPNPAFSHVDVPLASSFILSSKNGKDAYVQPVVEGASYRFTVKLGVPPLSAEKGTKSARGANFRCVLSDIAIEGDYIKAEGCAGRLGAKMMAIVAEGARGRIYLAPIPAMEEIARTAKPTWKPETPLPDDHRNFWTFSYGLTTYGDLFTPRQLVALTTFSSLVGGSS